HVLSCSLSPSSCISPPHLSSFLFFLTRPAPCPTLFPYTTLFRSGQNSVRLSVPELSGILRKCGSNSGLTHPNHVRHQLRYTRIRSEEHTSELQSRFDLVCRLLLEKKKKNIPCTACTEHGGRDNTT